MNYDEAVNKLKKYDQLGVLKYYDTLNEVEKQKLLNQIENIDFSIINKKPACEKKGVISPIKALKIEDIQKNIEEYNKIGLQALKDGKVAMIKLAGGMGTRLGSEYPKGMFNVGITHPLSIFECQTKELLKVAKECETWIYLFIMTSPKNHEVTKDFFKLNNYFGYNKDYVIFFNQDEAPTANVRGHVFMENPFTISTSPNGNGGWFSSLVKAGLLPFIKEKGIEYFNIYAVDNVLQKMADKTFIGATLKHNAECGAKVIKKAYPDERLGVMCLEDNHPSITEYYEITDELRNSKDENGNYLYEYGVILNYLFSEKALERILNNDFPLHQVEKKIAHLNRQGVFVEPQEPNGYKYETLVIDMIKMMDSCLPYEVIREKEFAPIKNLHGVDSVDTARELLIKNNYKL